MTHFLYFAYGSNMLTERLVARCPGAEPLGPAVLADHEVSFCTRGADGSGKAGLLQRAGAEAHGVLFRVPRDEQHILDQFESAPTRYRREMVVVRGETEVHAEVATYLPQPDHIEANLDAHDWYHALCFHGARQNGVATHGTAWLATGGKPTRPEHAHKMGGYEYGIAALRAAGVLLDDHHEARDFAEPQADAASGANALAGEAGSS